MKNLDDIFYYTCRNYICDKISDYLFFDYLNNHWNNINYLTILTKSYNLKSSPEIYFIMEDLISNNINIYI